MPDTTVHTIGRTARVDGLIDGLIDEVRISNVARSAAWITTEYNNQSSPATFYSSVGGEQQTTGTTGARQTVIGGDQSGRVYSMDAAAGFKRWGDTTALTGTNAVQAGVSAQVRAWSNAAFQAAYTDDVIFAATLNASATSNKVFALGASNGAVLWTFEDAGNGVDYIAGQPWVDYARNRIYLVSRGGSGSNQQSLWVIKTVTDGEGTQGQPVSSCPACTNLPATGLKGVHFETSPTLSYNGNTLYIGDTAGKLYAINANVGTLTLKWTLDLGAGANIKTSGFVWEDSTTAGRLYFVTADGNVRCVQDNGGSAAACPGWTVTNVPGASTPLLLDKLFVGANDGTVRQINLTNGTQDKQFPAAGSLDGTPLGAISTETGTEIFVGTSGGKIFKINLTSGALP
jgi:outer membrane protein assembly factor BamB